MTPAQLFGRGASAAAERAERRFADGLPSSRKLISYAICGPPVPPLRSGASSGRPPRRPPLLLASPSPATRRGPGGRRSVRANGGDAQQVRFERCASAVAHAPKTHASSPAPDLSAPPIAAGVSRRRRLPTTWAAAARRRHRRQTGERRRSAALRSRHPSSRKTSRDWTMQKSTARRRGGPSRRNSPTSCGGSLGALRGGCCLALVCPGLAAASMALASTWRDVSAHELPASARDMIAQLSRSHSPSRVCSSGVLSTAEPFRPRPLPASLPATAQARAADVPPAGHDLGVVHAGAVGDAAVDGHPAGPALLCAFGLLPQPRFGVPGRSGVGTPHACSARWAEGVGGEEARGAETERVHAVRRGGAVILSARAARRRPAR